MEARLIEYREEALPPQTVEVIKLDGDGPHVWKARSVPPVPGVQGYGRTDGEAVVNLLNAEVAARIVGRA